MSEPAILFTSAEAAKIIRCDPTSVINWTKKGLIACFTTPGGHRRYEAKAIADFMRSRNMPLPAELESLS